MKIVVFNQDGQTRRGPFLTLEKAQEYLANPNIPSPKKIFDESEVPPIAHSWIWNGNDSAELADRPQTDLTSYKAKKIAALKVNRDAALVSNYISNQAVEITKDENGDYVDGSTKYFVFEAKMVDNPASLPTQIVGYPSSAITLMQQLTYKGFQAQNSRLPTPEEFVTIYFQQLSNPDLFIAYSCDIIDSWVLDENQQPTNVIETSHKGMVKIDLSVASSIILHAKQRNDTIIQEARRLIEEINDATTIAQIDAIDITF